MGNRASSRAPRIVSIACALVICVLIPSFAQTDPADDFAAALDVLASGSTQPHLTVALGTFTYGYTGLGSSYSRFLEDLLSQAISDSEKTSLFVRSVVRNMDPEFRELYADYFNTASVDALLYGRFWESGDSVHLDLELTSLTDGELIGRTAVSMPADRTPPGISIAPPGLAAAASRQNELSDVVSVASEGFVVRATTSRGNGAVYEDGEHLQIHLFANQDAYLKVYHIDVNGVTQLIFPNQFQSDNRIGGGQFVQLPAPTDPFRFQLGPPYGVEFVKVVASTQQFADVEQSFQELGIATRNLVERGLTVIGADEPSQAETLVGYSIVEPFVQLLPAAVDAAASPSDGDSDAVSRSPTVEIEFDPIFPVFHSWYDDSPLGRATVTNNSDSPMRDVRLSLYVRQFMDNPRQMRAIPEIGLSQAAVVDIYGVFSSNILDITEGVKASALVTLDYTMGRVPVSREFVETIDVLNRNALVWDDDQKASAFVTAREPAVMRFARNVSGFAQDHANPGVAANLMSGMALHEALDLYGMHYFADPLTPYDQVSEDRTTIDFVQFPRQTLEYRGGDCDDLSTLYCALLESLGIQTAFVTVPGHIFVAFDLGVSAEEARGVIANPDDLILVGNTTWVPVEVTLRGEGFLAAWRAGAAQWHASRALGQAGFYPIHGGWETYPPVGLPGSIDLDLPDSGRISNAFSLELASFVDEQIDTLSAPILRRIETNPGSPALPNRLGILYARYGEVDRAISSFDQALSIRVDYVPAMVNLANAHYLAGDLDSALDQYRTADTIDPDRPDVLVGLSRVQNDLGHNEASRQTLARLEQVDHSLAARIGGTHAAGSATGRAAGFAGPGDALLWSDETEDN